MPFLFPIAGNGLADEIDERLAIEGLFQKVDSPGLERRGAGRDIAVSGHEDDGQSKTSFPQPALHFQSIHLRHPHVQQQAPRLFRPVRIQKFPARTKGPDGKARLLDEPRYPAEGGGFVVHDKHGVFAGPLFTALRVLADWQIAATSVPNIAARMSPSRPGSVPASRPSNWRSAAGRIELRMARMPAMPPRTVDGRRRCGGAREPGEPFGAVSLPLLPAARDSRFSVRERTASATSRTISGLGNTIVAMRRMKRGPALWFRLVDDGRGKMAGQVEEDQGRCLGVLVGQHAPTFSPVLATRKSNGPSPSSFPPGGESVGWHVRSVGWHAPAVGWHVPEPSAKGVAVSWLTTPFAGGSGSATPTAAFLPWREAAAANSRIVASRSLSPGCPIRAITSATAVACGGESFSSSRAACGSGRLCSTTAAW